MVKLVDGATVDSWQFEEEAASAFLAAAELGTAAAGVVSAGGTSARIALSRYHGDLLPDDRHEEWAVEVRERLKSRYVQLLDLLAAEAELAGEVDEAARLIQRAIEAEPYDEPRYLRLARLLASQGRTGTALTTIERARVALDELGLGLSQPMSALKASLNMN